MKIKLVFTDWQNHEFKSVYATEEGIELSIGQFHSGTTFDGEIDLSEPEMKELELASKKGYRPIFELMPDGSD